MSSLLIIVGLVSVVGGIVALMFYYQKSENRGQSRIYKIQEEKYDPNMTRASARREANASAARTAAAVQAVQEAQAANELTTIDEVFNGQSELSHQQHKHDLDNLVLQRHLISLAKSEGMDVVNYMQILQTRALNKAEIEKIEAQAQAQLKAGFIFKLQDYQHLSMLRDVLDNLYEKHYEVETTEMREPVKIKKLAQIDKDIELHEKDADGRRTRLLQTWSGDNTEGSDEDTELR